MISAAKVPIILSFNLSDPSGGIGAQADIETCSYLGSHCCPVITAIATQDSQQIKNVVPLPTDTIGTSAYAVLEDMPVAAFKIGNLVSTDNIFAVANILLDYPHIPVILDPMLRGFMDTPFAFSHHYLAALRETLFPLVTVLVGHHQELLQLTHGDTLSACVQEVLEEGTEHVLVVRAQECANRLHNALYSHRQGLVKEYEWDRIPGHFRGAGSTLSASIASFIAQGLDVLSAIREGQAYTRLTLKNGLRLGMGLPVNRRWTHSQDFK